MARYEVGDRVEFRGDEFAVLVAEPDVDGDIVGVDDEGRYVWLWTEHCTPVPEPGSRAAVFEAAVKWADQQWGAAGPLSRHNRPLWDVVQAWKEAQ